jgi:hypothetical protein
MRAEYVYVVHKIEIMYNTYYLDSKFDLVIINYKPPTNTGGFII